MGNGPCSQVGFLTLPPSGNSLGAIWAISVPRQRSLRLERHSIKLHLQATEAKHQVWGCRSAALKPPCISRLNA